MGQGTESCGGYELDCNPYEYESSDGYRIWHGKDKDYTVSSMTFSHVKNTIRLCKALAKTASFSSDAEIWEQWVEAFEAELAARSTKPNIDNPHKPTKKTARGLCSKMKCHCGEIYEARNADLNRGWGYSCSKRCASIRREFGRPRAIKLEVGE